MSTAGNTEGSVTFLKNNLDDIFKHRDRSLENCLLFSDMGRSAVCSGVFTNIQMYVQKNMKGTRRDTDRTKGGVDVRIFSRA